MKFLPKDLVNDIREKSRLFGKFKSERTIIGCHEIMEREIEESSRIHSYKMENPNLRVPFSIPRNKRRAQIKIGVKNLENAYKWGRDNFNSNEFNEYFIRQLTGKIAPEIFHGKPAEYRENGATIIGATNTPPYPYKVVMVEIPKFIESMRIQFNCQDVINRIETAIYSHLHLVRIHPFVDGNGRTSRTLQNILLNHFGVPTPIIECGERSLYYKILDNAISGWKDRVGNGIENGASEGEKMFYTFIAGKVNSSYDKLIETCLKHK